MEFSNLKISIKRLSPISKRKQKAKNITDLKSNKAKEKAKNQNIHTKEHKVVQTVLLGAVL